MKKICNPATAFCLKEGLPWEDFLFNLTLACPGRGILLAGLDPLGGRRIDIGVDIYGNV